MPLVGNSGHLTWVRHSSRKSSATHSYQCVQYFSVSRQWYSCQCLGFLTCTQMLMHAVAHGGCTDTVRESALKADSGRKSLVVSYRGIEPASVLRLAFWSDALPAELFSSGSNDRARVTRVKGNVKSRLSLRLREMSQPKYTRCAVSK